MLSQPTATVRLLELLPKSARYRDWPFRHVLLGYYVPRSEPRFIADGSLIHTSVVERMERVQGYKPVKLPTHFQVEGLTGPVRGLKARKPRVGKAAAAPH